LVLKVGLGGRKGKMEKREEGEKGRGRKGKREKREEGEKGRGRRVRAGRGRIGGIVCSNQKVSFLAPSSILSFWSVFILSFISNFLSPPLTLPSPPSLPFRDILVVIREKIICVLRSARRNIYKYYNYKTLLYIHQILLKIFQLLFESLVWIGKDSLCLHQLQGFLKGLFVHFDEICNHNGNTSGLACQAVYQNSLFLYRDNFVNELYAFLKVC
jgi:hypothetical protein